MSQVVILSIVHVAIRGEIYGPDAQVASRFEPLLISHWTATDAFRAFIVAYGKLLPLRKVSAFGEPAMIQTLIKHSSGVTGRVTWLMGRAAERAIEDGSELIRGAALWVAHALMSATHLAASDRDATLSLQQRQASYLRRVAPAGRAWLAIQQKQWPEGYRRLWWTTNPSWDISRYDPYSSMKH